MKMDSFHFEDTIKAEKGGLPVLPEMSNEDGSSASEFKLPEINQPKQTIDHGDLESQFNKNFDAIREQAPD